MIFDQVGDNDDEEFEESLERNMDLFQKMLQRQPFVFEEDDGHIDVHSICLLILLYTKGDFIFKSKKLFDLIKDDDGTIDDAEVLSEFIEKMYYITSRNMLNMYYDVLQNTAQRPSMEFIGEIRLLRRMPANHLDDFINYMVDRFLGDINIAIDEKTFLEQCQKNDYMFTEPQIFRKKFMVWCISSELRSQISSADLRTTNRSIDRSQMSKSIAKSKKS